MLNNIKKQYGANVAVKPFNKVFEPGVYGLLGANGAGKTTVMRMLCGLLNPSSGSIFFNGSDIKNLGCKYSEQVGYLPQDFGFFREDSLGTYMDFMASIKGLGRLKSKKRILEVIELVGLEKLIKKKIRTFSGGMKQRVGIAQAILAEPKVLILDEPSSGLDPKERVVFRNLISELGKDRIVILSTHIVSDVEFIANNILIMKKGTIIMDGSAENLVSKIKDKVWEVIVPSSEADKYKDLYCVSNVNRLENETKMRIISDLAPRYSKPIINPTLEELYLYIFDEHISTIQHKEESRD